MIKKLRDNNGNVCKTANEFGVFLKNVRRWRAQENTLRDQPEKNHAKRMKYKQRVQYFDLEPVIFDSAECDDSDHEEIVSADEADSVSENSDASVAADVKNDE